MTSLDEIVARQAAEALEIALRIISGKPYTDNDVFQLAESAAYALEFLTARTESELK